MNRTMFIGTDLYYSQEFINDRISELNECYKGIEQLNNIIHKAILELERYEYDNEANRYAPVKETLDILRGDKQVEKIACLKLEIERLNNRLKTSNDTCNYLRNTIDKAIEYMDRRDLEWGSDEHNKMMNILKGSDKE